MSKREDCIRSLVESKGGERIEYGNITIVRYTENKKPHIAAFRKGSSKPFEHLYYQDKEHAEAGLKKLIRSEEVNRAEQIMRNALFEEMRSGFKVGAILVSKSPSNRNIRFFKVVDLLGDKATIIEIGQFKAGSIFKGNLCHDHGQTIPDAKTCIGNQFVRKIKRTGSVSITELTTATVWNGRPVHWQS